MRASTVWRAEHEVGAVDGSVTAAMAEPEAVKVASRRRRQWRPAVGVIEVAETTKTRW